MLAFDHKCNLCDIMQVIQQMTGLRLVPSEHTTDANTSLPSLSLALS